MKTKSLLLALTSIMSLGIVGCDSQGGNSDPKPVERTIYDLPTEDGFFEYEDEAGNYYIGEFVNQAYDGFGKMQYNDGTYYEGTWKEGQWDGEARIDWNTGCLYIGQTKEGAMHGKGYMKWPMGDYYYGTWKNGQPNGYGIKHFLRNAYGETELDCCDIYDGNMVNGLPDGFGSMHYYFGAYYVGEWCESTRRGQGIYYWEETDAEDVPWMKFIGTFDQNWIYGEGTLIFRDGHQRTGFFDGNNLPLN